MRFLSDSPEALARIVGQDNVLMCGSALVNWL
jgi:hypothetical protein